MGKGSADSTLIGYVLKDLETGLYLDNRYRGEQWSKVPRVFKTRRGIASSLNGVIPRGLIEEFSQVFGEAPELGSRGVWTPEYREWKYAMWKWVREELKRRGGILAYYKNYQVQELRLGPHA